MSFPADVISAAVALDLVVLPGVFAVAHLKVLSARQPAPLAADTRIPSLTPQAHAERHAALPPGESMTRREAAALLGITERDARGMAAGGVLVAVPNGGGPARVTSASVSEVLARQNGSKESVS